jgi:cytochrome c-type biogenesis protein CcmH
MKKYVFQFLMLAVLGSCFAAQDVYPLDASLKQRFQTLTSEFRCLMCQNQNLAESNAPLASDLREQIYQKIKQGQSDKEIITYLASRYGDYVLYRPPFNIYTAALWCGPFLLLLLGLSYLLLYLPKNRR